MSTRASVAAAMLTTGEIKRFRKRLLAAREALAGHFAAMDREARAAVSGLDRDVADMADVDIEGGLTAELGSVAAGTINAIDDALGRIAEGTYGRCEACGEPIPAARLEMLPYAAMCVGCQAAWEAELEEWPGAGGSGGGR